MTAIEVDGEEAGSGETSWTRLSDGLIGGIHHTLNNRMAALSAVAQILESDLERDHPLAGAMSRELQRLEQTVTMLSLLVGGESGEPVQLESVIASARRLFEVHHSLRDLRLEVELSEDLYPLWIAPSALRRALLVMLAVTGRRARNGERVVRVRATGDEKIVEIAVSSTGSEFVPEEEEDMALASVSATGAGLLLRGWGGELVKEEAGEELVLRARVLTLPEARRREREGS